MPPRAASVVAALAVLASGLSVASADVPPGLGPGAERVGAGHYRIPLADGGELFTHGPDPKPNHGGSIRPGDPERPPVCATDYHQHVLYGRPAGARDRLEEVTEQIRSSMRRINAVLNESSIAAGDRTADYKVLCDEAGAIRVDGFTAPGSDFGAIVDGARAAGFDEHNADYTIFFDAPGPSGVCGIGSIRDDDRLTASNLSNSGGEYAVSYDGCWDNETPMHENGHNQGAVQYAAPNSTGSGAHCNDENDVMCYAPDGGDRNQAERDVCTDRIWFDCGDDTYFDPAPEEGEYLATHWNLGSPLNRFIVFGEPIGGPPRAAFFLGCDGLVCDFTDVTTDDGAVAAWAWDFGDGGTSSSQDPTHTYAEPGTYVVRLTATDNGEATASAWQTVQVPNDGDPDPSVPTHDNGVARADRNGPQGTWRVTKIFVPQARAALTVTLDGPACVALLCNPDLDLFVRHGRPPNRDEHACGSTALSNDESCIVPSPLPGYWYIGVHTFFGTPRVLIDTSSVDYTLTARA